MGADVKIRAVRAAGQTGGGDQDFTVSGFGTPKAAIFLCSLATADGTLADGAAISIGATDGTNQWAITFYDEHGGTSSDCYSNYATDEVVQILAADGTIDGEANFSTWITDGVRLTWGNAPAAAYLITVILIGGSDVSAKADTINLGTATTEQTYSGGSFTPTGGIFVSSEMAFASPDVVIANAFLRLGFAASHGGYLIEQCNYQIQAIDAAADANNTRYFAQYSIGGANTGYGTVITEFNSAGFKYANNGSASSRALSFLLLDIANGSIHVQIHDAKTSTGNKSFLFGSKPIATLWNLTSITAAVARSDSMPVEAAQDAGDGAYSTGLGISTGYEEFSTVVSSEDNAATMNTQSFSDDKCPVVTHDDGTALAVGTHVSFDALGQTINFTTAAGGAYKMPVMVFCDGSPSPKANYQLGI